MEAWFQNLHDLTLKTIELRKLHSLHRDAASVWFSFLELWQPAMPKGTRADLPKNLKGRFYARTLLALLKGTGRGAGEFESSYLPYWEDLGKRLREVLGEAAAERFLLKHQRAVAKLHFISPQTGNEALIEQISRLEELQTAQWLGQIETLPLQALQWVRDVSQALAPSSSELARMLSFAAAAPEAAMRLTRFRNQRGGPLRSASEFVQNLGRALWSGVLRRLKVPDAARLAALAEARHWTPEGLAVLTRVRRDPRVWHPTFPDAVEALKLIVKMSFQEDDFLRSIQHGGRGQYSAKQKRMLQEAVRHNREMSERFKAKGLDYAVWTTWNQEHAFEAEAADAKQKRRWVVDFKKEMLRIMGDFRNKSPGVLPWNLSKQVYKSVFKKWGLEGGVDEGLYRLVQKGKHGLFAEDFRQAVERLSGQAHPKLNGSAAAPFAELRGPGGAGGAAALKRRFKVRLWNRKPGRDLFQGNHTDCCIALGAPYFDKAGVIENYLLDTGINVVEVVEEETGRTVAQTFAYPVEHPKNSRELFSGEIDGKVEMRAKPFPDGAVSLVLDNVEINPNYVGQNREIRDAIFEYARAYARAFGNGNVQGIYLGVQENVEEGIPGDNIPTQDLRRVMAAMSKLGGPLGEHAYLDAFYAAKDRWHDGAVKTVPLYVVP